MVELLAPCHDWATMDAAIMAGANAVYFGVGSLNMRANALGFLPKDLEKIVNICHSKKVKAYLTLNSIVYEGEFGKAENIIKKAKAAGIDAVIISDLGLIHLLKKHNVEFHISTQASVSNSYSANEYKKLGAKRVILAREISLKDLPKVLKKSKIDIEVFIHGAMCASVSGRCFLSGAIYQKSANRGECMQPCRQEWNVQNKNGKLIYDGERFINAKDLCTISFLDKIIRTGVKSVKIEGRKKDPEYISVVVKVYREAIDRFDKSRIDEWIKRLSSVYNRGFSSGFYLGKPGKESIEYSIDGNASGVKKIPIGAVKNYYPKIGVAEIILNHSKIKIGDEIIISGKTTHFRQKIESIEINKKKVKFADKGGKVAIKINSVARKNDLIYKLEQSGKF
jgi:putative protease